MTNLESILKSRDITLPTKIRIVKAMVFPVVVYRCLYMLDHKEGLSAEQLMLLNCGAGEDSESPLDSKGIKPVNPKENKS